MVALKPHNFGQGCDVPLGKQERRGGIETPFHQLIGVDGNRKQERRGGIETRDNPAVAKFTIKKQERRGGIETTGERPSTSSPLRSRNAVVALKQGHGPRRAPGRSGKQERRGGIETGLDGDPLGGSRLEAGTPWWH